MTQDSLVPALDWLAATGEVDESWVGPEPQLINIQSWMDRLAMTSHHTLVAATYAAARAACQHWDSWLLASRAFALESLIDGQPPPEQLAAVARWLGAPTNENKTLAFNTVDNKKQFHWYHNEYLEVWFDEPGMWAIESSEYCVLSLTGVPYPQDTPATLATLSVVCAVNSFRRSASDDIRDSLSVVVDAIRRQLDKVE